LVTNSYGTSVTFTILTFRLKTSVHTTSIELQSLYSHKKSTNGVSSNTRETGHHEIVKRPLSAAEQEALDCIEFIANYMLMEDEDDKVNL